MDGRYNRGRMISTDDGRLKWLFKSFCDVTHMNR